MHNIKQKCALLGLIWIGFLCVVPLVTATSYSLGADGTGMKEFTDEYVNDNFSDIEATDLDGYKDLKNDLKEGWSDGTTTYTPAGADIMGASLITGSSEDTVTVQMHGDIEDIDGMLIVVAWFDSEFSLISMTNGTEIIAIYYSESGEGNFSDADIDGQTIDMEYDNDLYEYEEGDDYFVMTIFAEDWESSPDAYIFDYMPKPTTGLSLFGTIFSNPANLLLFVIILLIIIGIVVYAKYR